MKNYLSLGLKGKNQWWRYLITIVLLAAIAGPLGYIPTELYIDGGDFSGMSSEEIQEVLDNDDFEAVGLSQNIGLVTMLLTFVFGMITLLLCYRYLHKKKLSDLINPFQRIRWKHVFFGFGVWALIYLVSLVIDMLVFTEQYEFTLDWLKFLPLLAICIFLLPIQVAFEELLLRGYVMQGLYNIIKVPAFCIFGSALFFAALHLGNPEIESFGWYLMVPYYLFAAVMYGIITVWDKGLEIALGVHAANNILLALTVSYEGAVLQVDSIWTKTEYMIDFWTILVQFLMFIIMIYATYLFVGKEERLKT